MTFQELAQKKIVGVPVLYLGVAAVIILAIVAWRMKATPDADTAGTTPEDGTAGTEDSTKAGSLAGMSDPYTGFTTTGTVVAQSPSTADDVTTTVKTNSEWAKAGAEWLTSVHDVPGTIAISALSKYINGLDRSYAEQQYVDMVIKEKGQPPDDIAEGGNISSQPAQKQISTLPGKHTIKGTSDDTFAEIAQLYYNNASADRIDLLQAANAGIGFNSNGPFAAGTAINVPAYHAPEYYTIKTSGGETASVIVGRNGINLDQLAALNNPKGGRYSPTFRFAKGTSVRVK